MNPHCKIGKVTAKGNLVLLDHPAHEWDRCALDTIERCIADEVRTDEANLDSFSLYAHFADGSDLTLVLQSAECTIPNDLLGELVKTKVQQYRLRDIIISEIEARYD